MGTQPDPQDRRTGRSPAATNRSRFAQDRPVVRGGESLRVPVPSRNEMAAAEPHELLARDRRKYERLLLARLGGSLSKEDAEDIVSESLTNAFFSRRNHRWQVGLSNGSQLLAGCWASAVDTGGTCFDGMTAD